MLGKWAVVLPLLVGLNKVSLQPITEDIRNTRQLDLGECCPCPDSDRSQLRDRDGFSDSSRFQNGDCSCQARGNDADASASMLLPALRAIQPLMKQADEKTDPKPLLQPEVGLASSVLETLREATDEEYQDALARDAARSAVKIIESGLSDIDDTLTETPKKIVKIFLNPKDDMDDNLPEPSHVQETRCIHSPLQRMGQLRMNRPTPLIEVFESPRKPLKKLQNKGLLHKKIHDMDSGFGASNIKEQIMQPNTDNIQQSRSLISNPSLFDIFSQNSLEKRDDSQEGSGKLDLKSIAVPKKFKPKINLKLKDIIDNWNITSNKEKPKLPVIDLKKYFATTTKLPPLKLKPLEHSIYRNNGHLQLKDLLKLKDVELIPRKDVRKSKITEKSNTNDISLNENNCKNTNQELTINEGMPTISQPVDTFPSATNLNSAVLEEGSISLDESNKDMKYDSTDCIPSFVQKDIKTITPESIDFENQSSPTENEVNKELGESLERLENQSSFEIGNIKNEGNINSEKSLVQDDLSSNESNIGCLSPTDKKQQTNNDAIETIKIQDFENNEDIANDESVNNMYEIELFEDLNQPITFDNSSFIPEVDLNDSDNNGQNQEQLRGAVEETTNNDLRSMKQNEKRPTESQSILKSASDCISHQTSTQISNPFQISDENEKKMFQDHRVEDPTIMLLENVNNAKVLENLQQVRRLEDLHSAETNQEITEMIKESSEDSPNPFSMDARNTFSDLKDDSSQVSYRDLQEMSDSILNQAECASLEREDSTIIQDNLSEDLNIVQSDQTQIPNTFAPSSAIKENNNLKGIKSEEINDTHESFVENCDQDVVTSNNFDTRTNGLDTIHSEMTAAASESESKLRPLTNLKSALSNTASLSNTDTKNTKPTIVTKPEKYNILKVNKHTEILDSLKTKLENIFTTTERMPKNNMASNLDDTVNESSNNNPMIVRLDESKPLNKLQRTSQKLRESSPPKIPALNLDAYKNKFPLPKYLDKKINLKPTENSRIGLLDSSSARKVIQKEGRQNSIQAKRPAKIKLDGLENTLGNNKLRSTLSKNNHNLLESPFELTRPFDDIFDPSSLTAFSDRLRSHTENSLQNIKDTLETRLKETQSSDIFPPNAMDSQDILESITSRRDEFNEKLQAIHSDFNDRLSTFQQGLIDQLNVPSNRDSEINGRNFGLMSNYNPLQSPHLELFRSKSLSQPKNNLNILNDSTNRQFKLYEKPRFPYTEEPDLNEKVENKRPGLVFEKNHFLSLKEQLPVESIKDRKSSLHKLRIPSTTTKRPSLIPRPKFFKTKIDLEPKSFSDKSLNAETKRPSLSEEKLTKNKPSLTMTSRKNVFSEDPENSPSFITPSRSKSSEKALKIIKEETSDEESVTESPLEKLRKSLQQRNRNNKISNGLKMPANTDTPSNFMNTKEFIEKEHSNGIIGGTRLRNNDLTKLNGHRMREERLMDATHAAAHNEERVQIVEPLKENVPYKCKLICYKDV